MPDIPNPFWGLAIAWWIILYHLYLDRMWHPFIKRIHDHIRAIASSLVIVTHKPNYDILATRVESHNCHFQLACSALLQWLENTEQREISNTLVAKQAISQINAVLRMHIVMIVARKGILLQCASPHTREGHIPSVCKSADTGKSSSTQVRKKPRRKKFIMNRVHDDQGTNETESSREEYKLHNVVSYSNDPFYVHMVINAKVKNGFGYWSRSLYYFIEN